MSVHNTGAAGEGSQLGLGDSVYQRLLKERIIGWAARFAMTMRTRSARSCCCSRPRIRTAISTCTSTRLAAR